MKKVRIQFRHTGVPQFSRPRIQKMAFGWGYNLIFGHHFLAIRRPRPWTSNPFMDIDFGKAMLEGMRKQEEENRRFAALSPEDQKKQIDAYTSKRMAYGNMFNPDNTLHVSYDKETPDA